MSDDPELDELKRKIARAKKGPEPLHVKSDKPLNTLSKFFNAGIELISGVFVGVGFGLLFDWAFNTSPWGLISLFILGSIAGMLNVYRALTPKDKKDTKKDTHV